MKYEINLETIFSSVEGFTKISTNTEHTPSRCLTGKELSISNRFYLSLIVYKKLFTTSNSFISTYKSFISAYQLFLGAYKSFLNASKPFLSAYQSFLGAYNTILSACQSFLSSINCCLNQYKLNNFSGYFVLNNNNN